MTNLPGENRRRKKRYSLFALAWVWLSFLIIILLLVGMVVVVRAGETRQQLLRRAIDQSLQLAAAAFRNDSMYVRSVASGLLRQETFLAQIKRSDPAVADTLVMGQPQLDTNYFISVWNTQRRLIASSVAGDSVAYAPQILAEDLARALNGHTTSRIETDPAGHARSILVLPIPDRDSAQPVGVLIVGFYLNDTLAQPLLNFDTSQKLAVVSGGKFILAQIDGLGGATLVGKPAAQAVVDAEKHSTPTDFLTLESAQGNFEFKFIPLTGAPDAPSMLGIGIPLQTPSERILHFLNDYGLAFLSVFAVMGAVGLVYARGLNASLLELRNSMQRLSLGDLFTKIKIERGDEIGDLAGALERVRERALTDLEAAAAQKQLYVQTIAAMHAAVIVTDSLQRIQLVNPAAERLVQETAAQLEGKPWTTFFVRGANSETSAFAWEVTADANEPDTASAVHISNRLALRKYPLRKIDIVSSPIVLGAHIGGFVHVLQDASLHEEMQHAQEEFLLHAGHELRAPLTKLRAASELFVEAYEEQNWEQMGALVANMRRSLLRFQVFVENLIDIGSVQQGRFRVRPTRVDYNKVINETLAEIQPIGNGKQSAIELHSTIPTPCILHADPRRISQVLFNLLNNAIKYGGEDRPIVVSVFIENDSVVTQVTDYGPGIPPEEQALIFQRYYRGKSVEMEGMGIGVGLAIAREIIEQHGGEINVKSTRDDGTCFWFTLPAAN